MNIKRFSTVSFFLIVILGRVFQSCETKTPSPALESDVVLKSDSPKTTLTLKSLLRPDENLELNKVYIDTVQFIEYDDNGDDGLFRVKKGKDSIVLIFNTENPNFVRGNELEIKWKIDSWRPAGDPEYMEYREFLISAKVVKPLKLPTQKVKFLWRKMQYDDELKVNINTIQLNKNYLKTITDPEKAALAYAATFIGNECSWDGNANESRSNLKCVILSGLNLGYQCSNQHLGLLRSWFRHDKKILKELENCPTTPDGATVQDTFDEINLETSGNKITVSFKASGINLREGKSWSWSEKHFFEVKDNELLLLQKEVSPVVNQTFEVRGN